LLLTSLHTMRTKIIDDENRKQEKSGITSLYTRRRGMETTLRRLSAAPASH